MTKILLFARRWLLAFVDVRRALGLIYLPHYLIQWWRFQKMSGGKLDISDSFPCLTDRIPSTPFDPHYLYQAAWLARQLKSRPAAKHVDIASDARMIAVLSAFQIVEFADIRPLKVSLSGLYCVAENITTLSYEDDSIDSLSSLHVVEHIGLGRYGDCLDPDGSRMALLELQRVLSFDGRLFLSVPVGRERICFNAHRVFDPKSIIGILNRLRLVEFSMVDDVGTFHALASIEAAAALEYGCGLFVFEKPC